MTNELQPIFDYAKVHVPWLPTAWLILSGVMTLSRLVFKPWSQAMRERATLQLVDIAENGTPQECQEVLDRLHAGWYRAGVFWLDIILSIKLPTHIEFHRLVTIAEDKRTHNTMKNTLLLVTIASALFASGCATAPTVTGAGVHLLTCEIAKEKPATAVPFHAAGLILKAFGSATPPTQAELEAVLIAIPPLEDAIDQSELTSMWVIVSAAYGAAYNRVGTPEGKASIQLWFTSVGTALDQGSTCAGASAPPSTVSGLAKVKTVPTFASLGDAMKLPLEKIKR